MVVGNPVLILNLGVLRPVKLELFVAGTGVDIPGAVSSIGVVPSDPVRLTDVSVVLGVDLLEHLVGDAL